MSLAYVNTAIAAPAPSSETKEASLISLLFALFIALIVGLSFAAWHDVTAPFRRRK